MKHASLALWTAAGLSLVSAGAEFTQVHLEQAVSSRLTAIHANLSRAEKTTVTINRQLTLLKKINQSSKTLITGLNDTAATSSKIAAKLANLSGTVRSINQRVQAITTNTSGAAQTLHHGIAPARQVNQSLSQMENINRVIEQDLSTMLALDQSLNKTLTQTDRKIP